MYARPVPDSELLHRLFRYEPDTGLLYRRIRTSNFARLDKPAGTRDAYGYLVVSVLGFKGHYLVHRLVWQMVHGELPTHLLIDHINHIPHDNRIVNLRPVTHRENILNSRLSIANTTGTTGVYRNKNRDAWIARIGGAFLGTYPTEAEAVAARRGAELALRYHPNHGRVVQLEAA